MDEDLIHRMTTANIPTTGNNKCPSDARRKRAEKVPKKCRFPPNQLSHAVIALHKRVRLQISRLVHRPIVFQRPRPLNRRSQLVTRERVVNDGVKSLAINVTRCLQIGSDITPANQNDGQHGNGNVLKKAHAQRCE